VQLLLADVGKHGGPSVPDLLIAAAAHHQIRFNGRLSTFPAAKNTFECDGLTMRTWGVVWNPESLCDVKSIRRPIGIELRTSRSANRQ
jgi:hypothetical protein